MFLIIKLTLFALFTWPAQSEYRAFQLRILNTETSKERFVISSLDHLQYVGYYPLAKNEVATYVTSWMCRGRTGGFKSICKNPREQNGQSPAATSP